MTPKLALVHSPGPTKTHSRWPRSKVFADDPNWPLDPLTTPIKVLLTLAARTKRNQPSVSITDVPTKRRGLNEATSQRVHGFSFARSRSASSSRPRGEDSCSHSYKDPTLSSRHSAETEECSSK